MSRKIIMTIISLTFAGLSAAVTAVEKGLEVNDEIKKSKTNNEDQK